MVKRVQKTNTRTSRKPSYSLVAKSTNTLVKDLHPKDSDLMHYGPEPNYSDRQPDPMSRSLEMTKAYSWYSHFYGTKEAKDFFIRYLEDIKHPKVKLVRKAPDHTISPTTGWIARLATRGLVLDEKQNSFIAQNITRIEQRAMPNETTEVVTTPRANVQEIMRERTSEVGGDIDALYDEFLSSSNKREFTVNGKVLALLQSNNLLVQHVPILIKKWSEIVSEMQEILANKCEQLTEAYKGTSRVLLKQQLRVAEEILGELNGYVSVKKSTKKVRAKKPVPVERIVAKLKYCKSYKDDKLELTSLHPTKLHQAKEAFVYDTKKRRLYHYVADQYSGCLIVKANTILGFDKKESQSKILRNPVAQIPTVMGGKPAARKAFNDIKAVASCPNGRFNENIIILRAF